MAISSEIELGDIPLRRIGLGTNRLTNTPENVALIREAVEAGINMIDTAHVYTGGQSEETIGSALSSIPEGSVVATKGGYGAGKGRPEALRAQIEQSFAATENRSHRSLLPPPSRSRDAARRQHRNDRRI